MTDKEEPTLPFFMTPSEIYRQLTEGPGSNALGREQFDVQVESSEENYRAELIKSLASIVRSGWQGEASAGAYGAAMPLAERAYENSAKLDRSQDLLSRQIDSFNTAVHSVRPVSDPPESSMDEPFPFDVDYEKSVKEYQDSAQHNIAVFREYDGASSYNETNTPQEFHNETRSSGDVSVAGRVDTIPVQEAGPRSEEPGPRSSGEPRDSSSRFRDSSSSGGPWSTSGDLTDPAVASGGFETTPNDYRPVPAHSAFPGPSTAYPGPGQSSSVSAGSGGGFVGGGPVGSPGGGYTSGVGGRGPGGSSGGRPVGGGSGGVRGFGPGVGAGVGVVDEVARRVGQAGVGSVRSGGVGSVGAAPVGGGRGGDDEDVEHQRKVLIEADAEEIFGSDVLTAPQVIGDDEYED